MEQDTIPAYWLVVERTNGSAMAPTGTMIQLYDTEDEALAAASSLADKYRGNTYSIAKITAQVTVRPTAIVERNNNER